MRRAPFAGARPGRPLAAAVFAAVVLVAQPAAAQDTGTVSGRVTDELGNPLGGINLTLYPDGPSTVTDTDGRFLMTAPVGSYLLRYALDNRTWEVQVDVVADEPSEWNLTARGTSGGGGGIDPFPFIYLALAMAIVIVGGFYVNKRMAETGLEFDKSVMGGAPARKPFRRRRRPKAPPPSP